MITLTESWSGQDQAGAARSWPSRAWLHIPLAWARSPEPPHNDQPVEWLVPASGPEVTGEPLLIALAVAYVPTDSHDPLGFIFNDRVLNAPDWLKTKRYDIEARIDDAIRTL